MLWLDVALLKQVQNHLTPEPYLFFHDWTSFEKYILQYCAIYVGVVSKVSLSSTCFLVYIVNGKSCPSGGDVFIYARSTISLETPSTNHNTGRMVLQFIGNNISKVLWVYSILSSHAYVMHFFSVPLWDKVSETLEAVVYRWPLCTEQAAVLLACARYTARSWLTMACPTSCSVQQPIQLKRATNVSVPFCLLFQQFFNSIIVSCGNALPPQHGMLGMRRDA